MIFIAATGTRRLNEYFQARGWGAMYCRGRLSRAWPPRVSLWAFDNGAFVDWQHGRPFNEPEFLADLVRVDSWSTPPMFCVLPDRVAEGLASLAFSMRWFDRLPRGDWYLAVQDGMKAEDIPWTCGIAGIFVGGTTEWKGETLPYWVRESHARGLPVHVGRMGTPRKVLYARRHGVDSIDSAMPLWTRDKLREFVSAVDQMLLPGLEVLQDGS